MNFRIKALVILLITMLAVCLAVDNQQNITGKQYLKRINRIEK